MASSLDPLVNTPQWFRGRRVPGLSILTALRQAGLTDVRPHHPLVVGAAGRYPRVDVALKWLPCIHFALVPGYRGRHFKSLWWLAVACSHMTIRWRPSEVLSVGVQLEVQTRQSAFCLCNAETAILDLYSCLPANGVVIVRGDTAKPRVSVFWPNVLGGP